MARRGPRPKGNRFAVSAFLPIEVVERTDAMAAAQGVDRTAALTQLLCKALDLPIPTYSLPKSPEQQELPLKAS